MGSETVDTQATVRALLAAEGITPSDAEITALAQSYPGLRGAADVMYSPEANRFLPAFAGPVAALADADLEAR